MNRAENERRIVVTGLGTVNPLGNDVRETWENALAGKSGLVVGDFFPSDINVVGKVQDFHPEETFKDPIEIAGVPTKFAKLENYMSPSAIYAMAAVFEALRDAGAIREGYEIVPEINRDNFGIVMGSGMGGGEYVAGVQDRLREGKTAKLSSLLKILIERGATMSSIAFKIRGPTYCVASACTTGGTAINDGVRVLLAGDADIMVVGAAEAASTVLGASLFTNTGTNSKEADPDRASMPFDKERSGFVISEGAGAAVIERLDHALGRGVVPIAEITGWGDTADAWHHSDPSGEGLYKAIRKAMRRAGTNYRGERLFVSLHGTGTRNGDPIEAVAVNKACEEAEEIVGDARKSGTGHGLGSSGAVEAVVAVKTLIEEMVPPTLHLNDPIDELGRIQLVTGQARRYNARAAINVSAGFGGPNAATIFERYEGRLPTRQI